MEKQEFEQLAKIEVSNDDYYKIIEPMYMATELSKIDFIKTLNLKQFAQKTEKQYVSEMKKIAKEIKSRCTNNSCIEQRTKLENLVQEYCEKYVIDCSGFYFVEKHFYDFAPASGTYVEAVRIFGLNPFFIEII